MPTFLNITKKLFSLTGYEIKKKHGKYHTEYDHHINAAKRLNMDVNDYCEKTLEWGEKSNDISKNVEPYADSEGLSILEIGSGTGAYSRHLIKYSNRLILTDPNDGFILFLKNYFKNIRSRGDSIHIIKNDGFSFPGVADKSIDMVFGGGVFFYTSLYILTSYFIECQRILKQNGVFVFNFFNVSVSSGDSIYQYLDQVKARKDTYITVFNEQMVCDIANACGFELVVFNKSNRNVGIGNTFANFRLISR